MALFNNVLQGMRVIFIHKKCVHPRLILKVNVEGLLVEKSI